MIHKQLYSNTVNNNSKLIRLIWHRKGDLRLYDNELYHHHYHHHHHHHHNRTRNEQQEESTSTKQTASLNITSSNINKNNQLKIVSLYVINPDDYTPRLVTGSKVTTNTSVPYLYNNKNNNKQHQEQQQQQDVENENNNNSNPLWTVNEGPYASVALIDALYDLRINLQSLGGELLIRYGNPLVVLPIIISNIIQTILVQNTFSNNNEENNNNSSNNTTGRLQQQQQQQLEQQPHQQQFNYTIQIVWNEIPGSYEQKLSTKMKELLQDQFQKKSFSLSSTIQIQVQIHTTAIYTLYHPNDLPTTKESWTHLARPKEQLKNTKNRRKSKQSQSDSSDDNTNTNSGNNVQQQSLEYSSPVKNHFVNCNQSRWDGLPRIMGDFRRAARTSTNVRQCYPKPCITTIQSFPITSASLLYDTTVDTTVQDQHHHHHSTSIIESGNIPTLEQLTAPYKGKSLFGLPCEIFDKIICNLVSRQQLSLSSSSSSSSCTYYYGETSSLQRWDEFLSIHAATANRSLADTSNDQSAHISTALALGVLSPRHIYWSVVEKMKSHEHLSSRINDDVGNDKQENDNILSNNSNSLQWLQSHMEMRDHFIFSAYAAGDKLYNLHGTTIPIHNSKKNTKQGNNVPDIVPWKSINNKDTSKTFQKWALGQTGLPLIDSGMYELYYSGYISNRVRQNIASVLTKDLYIDWRIGAEYYQFWLIDHCVSANYGNWQYFSGVGNDPKNRHFRTISQSIQYDPDCTYVTKWFFNNTVKPVVDTIQHQQQVAEEEQKQTGSNNKSIDWEQYPYEVLFRPWDFISGWETIVDPNTQYTFNDKHRLDVTGNLLPVPDKNNNHNLKN